MSVQSTSPKTAKPMAEEAATTSEINFSAPVPSSPLAETPASSRLQKIQKMQKESARLNTRIADLRQQMKRRAEVIRSIVRLSAQINEQTRVVLALQKQLKSSEDPAVLQALQEQVDAEQLTLQALENDLRVQRQIQVQGQSQSQVESTSSSSPTHANIPSLAVNPGPTVVAQAEPEVEREAALLSPTGVYKHVQDEKVEDRVDIAEEERGEEAVNAGPVESRLQGVLDSVFAVVLSPEMFAIQVAGFYFIQQYRSKL